MVFTMQNEGPFSEGFWKLQQGQGASGSLLRLLEEVWGGTCGSLMGPEGFCGRLRESEGALGSRQTVTDQPATQTD